ncbi:hypothetical protein [Sphingobacterium detergens]|uniref:hypothetical protein n=1 Tax=Sphingobacterium detergens TaxID=1145106 RepID=UPI003AAE19A5
MNKLTLQVLAAYLPYEPKMQVKREDSSTDIITLNANKILLVLDGYYWGTEKLILRPMSDLTKKIEHNGLKFVPTDRINQYQTVDSDGILHLLVDGSHWSKETGYWSYNTVQELLSYHFDVFNLIPKGLAKDFKTLNPKNDG